MLDELNGNTLWQDAIWKEMDAVRVAFRVLNDGEKVPPGYQVKCIDPFLTLISRNPKQSCPAQVPDQLVIDESRCVPRHYP